MIPVTISAVITTHRRPEYLAAAMDSVIAQTWPVDEILVVEDGEDPDTAEVVSARAAAGIAVRHLRAPRGAVCPAASRNIGLEAARSSHVAFLDDDDTWSPGKIAAQALACQERVLVCGNARRTDGDPYFPGTSDRLVVLSELDHHNPVITSTVLARCDALIMIGGFDTTPRLRGAEDYDAWLRLAECYGPFRYLGAELAGYDCAHDARLSHDHVRGEVRLARVRGRALRRRPLLLRRWASLMRSSAGILLALTRAT